MAKWLKALLDLLPFDGDKTKLGVFTFIVAVIAQVHSLCPTCGLGDLVAALTADPISWLAVVTAVIGLFHKQLKSTIK